jgi:hypothetical protein
MVELEEHGSEPKTGKKSLAIINLVDIIEKVMDLVSNVREMTGKPVDVKLESFNFAFSKAADGGNCLSLDAKIVIKPK